MSVLQSLAIEVCFLFLPFQLRILDQSIPIDIVNLECPGQFLLHSPLACDVHGHHELPDQASNQQKPILVLPEVNPAIPVAIKCPEGVFTNCCWVTTAGAGK